MRTLTTAALTAKAIRSELKKAFPKVKFSVKSDNFAGGNSVDINWTDGPTAKEVENVTGKYQYGRFDGMNDLYEYSNDRKDIPQVKYVMEQRRISDETRANITEEIKNKYSNMEEFDSNKWCESFNCWGSDLIYRFFNERTFA